MTTVVDESTPAWSATVERGGGDTRDVDVVVAQLERVLRDLDAAVVGTRARMLEDERRRRALRAVDRAATLLSAVRGDLLIAERDSDGWRGSGDPSYEAYRGRVSRGGRWAAVGQMRSAEVLSSMPTVREAATAGEISLEHVEVMAKVVAGADAAVREAMASPNGQADLVRIAKRVDATQFSRSAAAWVAAHDPVAHERGHQAQRAARYLHVTDTPDGTFLKGRLDAMAGHRLRLALEAVSPRPGVDETRSSEQRRADALVDLAEAVLAAPTTTSGASVRPHVSFHMTEQTWMALRARGMSAGSRPAAVDGSTSDGAVVDGPAYGGAVAGRRVPVVPVTLDDGSPVPFSEVARVLCDCELTRIVVGAERDVLDVGRAARTYTGGRRRAVIARDRHCGWPGCVQPARWCEVHHIRWWDRDDGATSVENGVLLCSFHHHEVHRHDYTLVRRSGAPPGAGEGLNADPSLVRYSVRTSDGREVAPESRALARAG